MKNENNNNINEFESIKHHDEFGGEFGMQES